MPIGAELQPQGGVHFRVWAPAPRKIALHVDGRDLPLRDEGNGYFSLHVPEAAAGSRYGYRVDDYPPCADPASRLQPDGPHGLSAVTNLDDYNWQDGDWRGAKLSDQVIYEMHVGTFTPEGTWRAAAEKLPLLAEVGISTIEMMPIADFPGSFGWGYDGVCFFAPTRLYGTPNDLKRFIDTAHRIGIAVILDVVYNHFGPDGNFLPRFSDYYLTDKYPNEWGQAINFDGPHCEPVREFVRENAAYWIREFHFDGLRLDATQQIFDASREHVLTELAHAARENADGRDVLIVAENEPQESKIVRPIERGGYGLDALWNDDFHHSARVALTGHREAYYSDYTGSAAELAAAVKHGFLYQGQRSAWQRKRRGFPSRDIERMRRITFLENHDQVANSATGRPLSSFVDAGLWRAMTALLLLGPGTPMLFQGQEFGSLRPFLFFADHNPELAKLVANGRAKFLSQFPSVEKSRLDPPDSRKTFTESVLDWRERDVNAPMVKLHRDLVALRRADAVLRTEYDLDTGTLGDNALIVRFFSGPGDRVLIVNLGPDLTPQIFPQPLLAPPVGRSWSLIWSSEDPQYGGEGVYPPETDDGCWRFPGHAAVLLAAK
jgi:maltooligosyltrehalose trehalohydrolase